MGSFLCNCFDKSIKILVIGLKGTGKTTFVERLRGDLPRDAIDRDYEKITHDGHELTVCDLIGDEDFQGLWGYYYHNKDLVVYVIDSSDKTSLETNKNYVHSLFNDDYFTKSKFLIIANKQDNPNAIGVEELISLLDIRSFIDTKCHIQGTCATSGDGINEALGWIKNQFFDE